VTKALRLVFVSAAETAETVVTITKATRTPEKEYKKEALPKMIGRVSLCR
jgi:hypothetical protein